MRVFGWLVVATVILVGAGGCERRAYTEEDARQAIAERQQQFQTEIERGVRAAPPVSVETPSESTGATSGSGVNAPPASDTSIAVPPPPTSSTPPAGSSTPAPSAPTTLGEARYNPETRQYGVQPPGAPDTYTVPLGGQNGQ